MVSVLVVNTSSDFECLRLIHLRLSQKMITNFMVHVVMIDPKQSINTENMGQSHLFKSVCVRLRVWKHCGKSICHEQGMQIVTTDKVLFHINYSSHFETVSFMP